MGRRRRARKPPAKAKLTEPLAKQFNCPFCNHENSCEVTLDMVAKIGQIKCNVCMEDFQCEINHLSEPIDVYAEWVDACEDANES